MYVLLALLLIIITMAVIYIAGNCMHCLSQVGIIIAWFLILTAIWTHMLGV